MITLLRRITIGMALGFYLSAPVMAEDIEIYTDSNSSASTAQPNVMFIMDSSDSMRRLSTATAPTSDPYDPDTTYPTGGGTGSFSTSLYYFSATSTAPTSHSNNETFNTSALVCDHALHEYVDGVLQTTTNDNGTPDDGDPLNGDETADDFEEPNDGPLITVGFYSGQLAQYKDAGGPNDEWRSIATGNSIGSTHAYLIECIQDQGIHGPSDGATDLYLKNNNNDGWGSTEDTTVTDALWAEAADNYYTIYHGNYLNYLEEAPTSSSGISMFQQLKNAIATIVASASNVNIGLIGFDNTITSSVADDGLWIDDDGDTVVDNGETGNISDDTDPTTGTGGEGGAVQYPAIDVNAGRQNFYTNLRNMDAEGDAPLSETYYEVLKYFGGEEIDYGNAATPALRTGTKETGNPTHYQTPITESCQKNYVVILSGGLASYDYLNETRRSSLYGFDKTSCGNTSGVDDYDPTNSNRNASSSETSTNDNCLDELALWAHSDDIARRDETDGDYLTEHAGEQNITTYTVGFAVPDKTELVTAGYTSAEADALVLELADGVQLLQDTAENGGGEFVEAANENELVDVLNSLLSNILKVNSTFSSPAVSVNAFNRSTHLNDLFFTLFKPDDGEHWTGNLKKYKLEFDTDGVPFIADVNGNLAVSNTSGFFNEDSKSYWSENIDGDEAGEGGAAALLTNTSAESPVTTARKLYTITGGTSGSDTDVGPGDTAPGYSGGSSDKLGVYTAVEPDLTAAENLLSKDNTVVTDGRWDALLDIDSTVYAIGTTPRRETLLDWANGVDVFDEVDTASRKVMGDPLHAEPALIQYGLIADGPDEGTELDPDLVSYVATNDGYLHAFDASDQSPHDDGSKTGGTELWAFVPQELLPNLDHLMVNNGSNGKIYGLDGSVVPWIKDVDEDGYIESADGDHVYIYFGMRRGMSVEETIEFHNFIYALDVTDRNSPKFLWKIDPTDYDALAGDPTHKGRYRYLGQTWSTINVEKIKVGNAERTVLMFGGGYDIQRDADTDQATSHSHGAGIYIVDAEDGELLYSAGSNNADVDVDNADPFKENFDDMKYSIPARIKPLDINGDGYIDRIYFGDLGGQLWRFDIAESTADTFSTALSDVKTELINLIDGGVIADLTPGTPATVTDNRRFFYPPDVAFIVEEGQGAYLAILAASGFRAHPLQTATHDRIYMIRDKDIYEAPTNADGDIEYTKLTETDLYDATENLVTEGADQTARDVALASLSSAEGWYIDLNEPDDSSWVGEKALSEPLIFSSIGIVTTYLPPDAGYQSADICKPNDGAAGIFYLNIADATPVYFTTGEVGTRSDRRQLLKRGGIPPTPSVIVTADGTPTLCVGTECVEATDNKQITKTYWYEIENPSATISP